MKDYFKATSHNSSLAPWEHEELMPVFQRGTGEWEVAPLVGSYGTFQNPVVLLGGQETILEPGWLNPTTGEVILERCLGRAACGSCDGTCPGCRFAAPYTELLDIWYI